MPAPQAIASTRKPAPAARRPDEEAGGGESLGAHAKRVLRARLSASVAAILDPGIALLLWLRKAAGCAQDAEAGDGESRSRLERPGARAADPAAASAAPVPRRRLRAFLVYVGVLLAGGMGGGALAFELLETLLIDLAVDNQRLQAALAKEEKSSLSARQEAANAQAGRSAVEKKLAALRTEMATAASGKQDQPAPARTPLKTLPAETHAGRQASAPKAVDCSAIPSDNINALMDCIHKFNR